MYRMLKVFTMMALLAVFTAFVPTVHAQNNITVASSYGSQKNQHMVAYTIVTPPSQYGIECRLISADGTPKGSPVPVVTSVNSANPAIAYDSVLDRFLVVWGQYDGQYWAIKGRILESNGTYVGNEVAIRGNSDNIGTIKIAYSPSSQRYLVVFHDAPSQSISGQFINGDGTLEGSNFTAIAGDSIPSYTYAVDPNVAYDSVNHRFLIAADAYGYGAPPMAIYGVVLNDNGTVFTSPFFILDSATYLYPPAIAYDPVNQRFLVNWEVYFGDGHGLWGQLINADGTLYGTHQVIVSSHTVELANDVIYHSGSGRFLAAWSDDRGAIYGQEVNSDGTNYNSEFSIVNPHQLHNVSLAYNSTWENTLVTYRISNNIVQFTTTGTSLPNSTLTVSKTGQGSGTVSSVPPGINCGAECSENYLNSTAVTLTASADSGFVFEGWSGGSCTGTGTCVVTISGNVTVTATFALPSELLPAEGTIGTQITITGSGFGTKKGKVLIGGVAAKIGNDGWADDRIVALLTKVPPPGRPYDVTINLKSKPPSSILLGDAFTVRNPRISSYSLSNTHPGAEVTVDGFFFGGKKGKVYLVSETGSNKPKSCKVTYWYMDPTDGMNSQIKFMIPKVEPGSYWLYISNKAGSSPIDVPFRVD
jgi:hypothetical protein